MLRQRDLGGERSKLGEQLHLNDTQVREAERRLGLQHTFIARLHASSRDTTCAQELLEVMRDILRGFYQQRSQLRRRIASDKEPSRAAVVACSAPNTNGQRRRQ